MLTSNQRGYLTARTAYEREMLYNGTTDLCAELGIAMNEIYFRLTNEEISSLPEIPVGGEYTEE